MRRSAEVIELHPEVEAPLLEARDVSLHLAGATRLKIPVLRLKPGGPTMVLGPNGAGKSLLLRLLHGLIPSDTGTISCPSAHRQAMVFQQPVLLRRSVAANLDFALRRVGLGRSARRASIDHWLNRANLSGKASQAARSLSVGEQQRLALVRALATEPRLLFLDEPTSSLDPSATMAIEWLITEASVAGTKIVMVTHDLGQARRLGDDIMFLHQGQVAEHRAAAGFFETPASKPARRFLDGALVL